MIQKMYFSLSPCDRFADVGCHRAYVAVILIGMRRCHVYRTRSRTAPSIYGEEPAALRLTGLSTQMTLRELFTLGGWGRGSDGGVKVVPSDNTHGRRQLPVG